MGHTAGGYSAVAGLVKSAEKLQVFDADFSLLMQYYAVKPAGVIESLPDSIEVLRLRWDSSALANVWEDLTALEAKVLRLKGLRSISIEFPRIWDKSVFEWGQSGRPDIANMA